MELYLFIKIEPIIFGFVRMEQESLLFLFTLFLALKNTNTMKIINQNHSQEQVSE